MVIDVRCIIMLFTTANQMWQMCQWDVLFLFVWLLFTPWVMFRHYHQAKSIHTSNYKWLQSHSCRLHDVRVVTINRQCIELKGLPQIVLWAVRRLPASKNGYFCRFVQSMDRPHPIPRIPRYFPQALRAPVFQRGCSQFSSGYYQTVNLLTMRDGKY